MVVFDETRNKQEWRQKQSKVETEVAQVGTSIQPESNNDKRPLIHMHSVIASMIDL